MMNDNDWALAGAPIHKYSDRDIRNSVRHELEYMQTLYEERFRERMRNAYISDTYASSLPLSQRPLGVIIEYLHDVRPDSFSEEIRRKENTLYLLDDRAPSNMYDLNLKGQLNVIQKEFLKDAVENSYIKNLLKTQTEKALVRERAIVEIGQALNTANHQIEELTRIREELFTRIRNLEYNLETKYILKEKFNKLKEDRDLLLWDDEYRNKRRAESSHWDSTNSCLKNYIPKK